MESKNNKLPSQVKALGMVSFFNDIASEMIFPLLPAFVTGVLGLSPQVLGIMEGIADTAAATVKYLSGWWSDKIKKRKPLAVAGYSLSSTLRPLIGVASAAWHIVALRTIDRIGKGLRTSPRDVLLSASVQPSQRGKAFGFHRAMDHSGAMIGPVIALALLSWVKLDLRTLFLLSALPSLITIALIVFAVKEDRKGPKRQSAQGCTDKSETVLQWDQRSYRIFLAAMILFTLGNSTDVFLVLHAHELGLPVRMAPLLWLVLHLAKSLFASPGGALSDRIGRKRTILLGWGIYALAYMGFALADQSWQIWPLFFFYGLFYGLTEGPEKAFTADIVPQQQQGKGFGLYHMSIGLAALPASVVAGYLWSRFGAPAALGLGAGFAALAAVVLAIGLPARR